LHRPGNQLVSRRPGRRPDIATARRSYPTTRADRRVRPDAGSRRTFLSNIAAGLPQDHHLQAILRDRLHQPNMSREVREHPNRASARHQALRRPQLHLRANDIRPGFGRAATGFSPGQLISRYRRACIANQPIRLFQNVGICRLFSGEEAEHHEGCAK
jgi:hypothetical protein